ncbi:MAG: hypothetical protein RLZZ302_333, partial [Actinomycetota bacterium]
FVRERTGLPQSTFIVLFLLTLTASACMHIVIMRLLSKESPHLENRIDTNTSLTIGA